MCYLRRPIRRDGKRIPSIVTGNLKLSRWHAITNPQGRDFTAGTLLGCVSGELGLRKFLEDRGHTLVVTSDKDADGCEADRELVDADIVVSQPFWPHYLTKRRMESAQNLKLAVTAGIGSDHVDLQAAMDHNVDVVEVTYCNSRSVAEHIVMMILAMVRDYHPQHRLLKWRLEHCRRSETVLRR